MTGDRAVEYFLSCYLSAPGDLAILAPRHDHGVALWRRSGDTVELARFWEVERVSGQKHHGWPLFTVDRASAFLDGLLADEGLSLRDMRHVWGTPGLPGHADIEVPAGSGAFPVHSLAHLFSGLLMDTKLFKNETIIAMAMDGAPDAVLDTHSPTHWYAGAVSDRGRLTFLPIESPGPLYAAASTMFGMEPGSLMALASACRTAISFDIVDAVAAIELFGGRNAPWAEAFGLVETLISRAEAELADDNLDDRFTREENLRSAVMKHVQRACDLIAIRNVERLSAAGQVRTQDCYLSTSGGFALNCPTNTLLLDTFGFRGLLTPPVANDSGQALGLGMLALHGIGALDEADFSVTSGYYGAPLRDVDEALQEFAPWVETVTDFDAEQFVADVTDSVIVWVDGSAEIGPRALGHRSLLGDPRSMRVRDLLNKYKQRQWWRPVAPIVLADHSSQWFESTRPSPFMLEAVKVREEVRDRVPAIVHLDGSARHQTLTSEVDPLLYRAIDAFHARTGVPILCNTSLNDKNEPIVDNAAQALTFCVNKGIEVAYLAGRRVALRRQSEELVPPGQPRQRAVHYFAGQEPLRDAIWRKWLDQGYTEGGVFLLSWSPGLRLTATPKASMINRLADHHMARDRNFASLVRTFRRDGGPGSSFIEEPGDLPRPFVLAFRA
ncbi:hypothetical protein N5079_28585 [Planotetraspora sp. A-T 1434]|uniref:carbamoyltransferase C-terminal domain-containing protein n=1 Tax=Planotetraspora sp. A-T 1434 TaxID=2979219 RepID=UPI0021BEC8A9|nr:carbamoyltransferase C-terminal domain-containing protein [Planotetraspora sp. A-T 1434]MCT9934166.1 hypothetical protein [Planotetraspora sp. A-T 1434]